MNREIRYPTIAFDQPRAQVRSSHPDDNVVLMRTQYLVMLDNWLPYELFVETLQCFLHCRNCNIYRCCFWSLFIFSRYARAAVTYVACAQVRGVAPICSPVCGCSCSESTPEGGACRTTHVRISRTRLKSCSVRAVAIRYSAYQRVV